MVMVMAGLNRLGGLLETVAGCLTGSERLWKNA